MPPKIRDLIAQLERNDFTNRGGKGSHRNYHHPKCTKIVTISGKEGNDAQKYQIKQVKDALIEVKNR